MGAAASIAFGAGVAWGAAWAATGVVNDALDSVCDAAEEVIAYLGKFASAAFDKLKAAAAAVKDRVVKLVRRLLGGKEADAARSEVDRAASAQDAGHDDDVLSRASARVAGFGQLRHVKALPPPPSSSAIVVSSAAPGGALALLAAPAARAARRASEMMALLKTVVAAIGDGIPEEARSCIFVVVAAGGIGLEAIAAAADA